MVTFNPFVLLFAFGVYWSVVWKAPEYSLIPAYLNRSETGNALHDGAHDTHLEFAVRCRVIREVKTGPAKRVLLIQD